MAIVQTGRLSAGNSLVALLSYEVIFLVGEKNIECRQGAVAPCDVLLQADFFLFGQNFVTVDLLFHDSYTIADHYHFMKENLQGNDLGFSVLLVRFEDQLPALPSLGHGHDREFLTTDLSHGEFDQFVCIALCGGQKEKVLFGDINRFVATGKIDEALLLLPNSGSFLHPADAKFLMTNQISMDVISHSPPFICNGTVPAPMMPASGSALRYNRSNLARSDDPVGKEE